MEEITHRLPEGFSEYKETLMSNCYREIDKETEAAIKGKDYFSRYAGEHFNGQVWWLDNKWFCEVFRYGHFTETFVCDTTEEIMEKVSFKYGND